jgi:hypothetical protein
VRELTEGDPARAPLTLDTVHLVEVRDVGAHDLRSGHGRTPLVEVPVGHAPATRDPSACGFPRQPGRFDTPLDLLAGVAELRLVERLALVLAEEQEGGGEGVPRRHRERKSNSWVPRGYHFLVGTTSGTKLT